MYPLVNRGGGGYRRNSLSALSLAVVVHISLPRVMSLCPECQKWYTHCLKSHVVPTRILCSLFRILRGQCQLLTWASPKFRWRQSKLECLTTLDVIHPRTKIVFILCRTIFTTQSLDSQSERAPMTSDAQGKTAPHYRINGNRESRLKVLGLYFSRMKISLWKRSVSSKHNINASRSKAQLADRWRFAG